MPAAKRKRTPRQDSASASSPSDTLAALRNYLRAGYPGLYLVSPEEQRVEAELKAVAADLDYQLFVWSVADGLVNVTNRTVHNATDPLEVLEAVAELPERSLLLLKDFHLFLAEPNPFLIRKLKDTLLIAKTRQKPLVILGCRLCLPPELERELTVIEHALPDRDQLGTVLDGICNSAGQSPPDGEPRDQLVAAASGLTTMEAENAFALAVVERGQVNHEVVAREKAQAVKKNGLLEIVETRESLEDIGGLDVLKDWLLTRRHAFSREAKAYGLPAPKGLLIVGVPGTGKSLTAKATAKVFGVPLLKLDVGRIYGGLVGQSEANLRSVIQTAEAIAPCVLMLDEIEKAFAGSNGANSDGGTSSRVFGSFLNWMQERTSSVFVVATANDVSRLPPEMLRKGRLDELFFVDLPNEEERRLVWAIQIRRFGRNPEDFDLRQLARITEGHTGAEIEQVFIEALYAAYAGNREPTDLDIAAVLGDFVPLSRLMSDQIKSLRQWANGRTRAATSTVQSAGTIRKLAA
jgi:ATP-dependent 26S proteasome regulatory subunit